MKYALILPVVLLAACSGGDRSGLGRFVDAERPSVPPPGEDTCQAAPYERLVGQDGTALERELILRQVRIIRPGMVVTADVRPERINFEIAADARISRIYCG